MVVYNKRLLVLLVLLLTFVLIGCTPQPSAISPSPLTPQPASTPASPSSVAPQISAQEAAWDKIVQAAKKEERLVAYDTGSMMSGDKGRAVAQAFKDKYGITIEFLITGGSSVTIEKLQVERKMGQSIADIAGGGSISIPRMVELDFGVPLANELPVLKDKSVFKVEPVQSPGGEMVNAIYTRVGPGFNSNLVKREEVQSHFDLLNPKWKGKIIMRDPRLGSGGTPLAIVGLRHAKVLDDDYFRRFASQQPVLSAIADTELSRMVARGDYPIIWGAGIDSHYAPLIAEGSPLRTWPLKEGTMVQTSGFIMTKEARHPNAAKLFINWLLTAEGQTVYHRAAATPPIRRDVPDFSPPEVAKEDFSKLVLFTWDMTLAAEEQRKAGVMEQFFGKR